MSKIYGLIFLLCSNIFALVDPDATQETFDLYNRLKSASGKYIYYGEYVWSMDKQIDTYKITGKFPTIYMTDYYSTVGDKIKYKSRKHELIKHYLNDGIISMCWHMNNFVTGGTSRDFNGLPVTNILEGGTHRTQYLNALDKFAKEMKKIKIPIIFRPFHEGDTWSFWWGTEGCTSEEFVLLWRDLVTYLRDVKGVHNLLYCYAPEILTEVGYKEDRFPGEAYIDIYSIDNYSDSDNISDVMERYRKISDFAVADNKIFGISEGLRKLSEAPKSDYWTWYYNQILNDPKVAKTSFVCNWHSPEWGSKKGRSDEGSFLDMSHNPRIKFLERKKGILISGINNQS
jgi:beta-mannanase